MVNPYRILLILILIMGVILKRVHQALLHLLQPQMQFLIFPDLIPLTIRLLSHVQVLVIRGDRDAKLALDHILLVEADPSYQLQCDGFTLFFRLVVIKGVVKHLVGVFIVLFQRENEELVPFVVLVFLDVE